MKDQFPLVKVDGPTRAGLYVVNILSFSEACEDFDECTRPFTLSASALTVPDRDPRGFLPNTVWQARTPQDRALWLATEYYPRVNTEYVTASDVLETFKDHAVLLVETEKEWLHNTLGIPTAEDLADQLEALQREYFNVDQEVRLQIVDGGHAVHFGDPSYDQDHRGLWASGVLQDSTDSVELAEELIRDVVNSWHENL